MQSHNRIVAIAILALNIAACSSSNETWIPANPALTDAILNYLQATGATCLDTQYTFPADVQNGTIEAEFLSPLVKVGLLQRSPIGVEYFGGLDFKNENQSGQRYSITKLGADVERNLLGSVAFCYGKPQLVGSTEYSIQATGVDIHVQVHYKADSVADWAQDTDVVSHYFGPNDKATDVKTLNLTVRTSYRGWAIEDQNHGGVWLLHTDRSAEYWDCSISCGADW